MIIKKLLFRYRQLPKGKQRIYARPKDWSPTIYSVASKKIETSLIEDAYYKVVRITDDIEAIAYGTGSDNICTDLGNILQILCDYEKAAFYYGMINSPSGDAQAIECLYRAGQIDQFYEALDACSKQTETNIRIAALSAFAANQLKREEK